MPELSEGGDRACWLGDFALDRDDIRTRADVRRLVVELYRNLATDDLLGPVVAAARIDWDAHCETLTDVWARELLGLPGDDANPVPAHRSVRAGAPLAPEHHERWLQVFWSTVDEHFAGPTAELACATVRRLVSSPGWCSDDDDAPNPTRWPRSTAPPSRPPTGPRSTTP